MKHAIPIILLTLGLAACSDPAPGPEAQTAMPTDNELDPYLWLEDVEGERALTWVQEQNDRTLATLTRSPGYQQRLDQALDVVTSDDRIPYGTIRDGMVYNFWQDAVHVRGLWRRTPLASYRTKAPKWETIIDFDALAEEENKNWVFKGANCFRPKSAARTLCMISLSDGGKDAVVQREFDLTSKRFVANGFETPEAKQTGAWVDPDTLLLATDWGGDGSTLTESGYPSSVRLWKRGQALSAAKELYRGEPTDVGVYPWTMELSDGSVIYGAIEADTFFTRRYTLLSQSEPLAYPLPPKATLGDRLDDHQFLTLQQDWTVNDTNYQSGDLLSFNLRDFLQNRTISKFELVFRAGERQAVNEVQVTSNDALLSINDNVISRLLRLERGKDGWQTKDVPLPGTGQASILFADAREPTAFINYEGFLTPDTLLAYDSGDGVLSPLKSLPAKFDATGLTVTQREATSSDGTRVPYFLVHRKDIEPDGENPTLLYAYGGFQVSMRPSYSPVMGRLWLEQGGVYALANIRGGGEFGPEWHQAGLKQNRQRIYDDFIAVAEDLITTDITSPERLGIMGGSNGGLLMGVMLTQRPDLWNAIVIQVPLLDMLRYHLLLAGASWIDEYGDPDIPEERAFLETISPYQNFDPDADYPTPLFVTSTKDDRVHPAHARKMAQRFQASEKPFLYYENIDGGHSAAANQQETAKRVALEYTYLVQQLFGG